MTFGAFIFKNIARRPMRSALTVFGLSVATATVVALVGVSLRFKESFLELYTNRGSDFVVQRSGGMQRLNNGIDEKLGDEIRRIPGVSQVIGGLMDMVSFQDANLYAVIVNGWSLDCPVLDRVKLLSGRRFQAGDRRQAMLGKILAANLGKTTGDKVEIYAEEFTVVGVFESFSVYENGAAFLRLEELQQLMNRPKQVTGYVVEIDGSERNPAQLDTIRAQIERLAPNVRATPTAEFVGSISQFELASAAAWIVSSIAVVIGAVGMLNTMIMAVAERTREIGTLRAIGWRKSRVAGAIVLESLLLGLAGSLLGCLWAVLVLRLLSRLPSTGGLVDGGLSPIVLAEGIALAMLICAAGAAYPAYWGANLSPMEAIRKT